MTILLIVFLILVCMLLGFFILIQNPKGGGLGAIGGVNTSISNQFGVQHSTSILEKGTYILVALIAAISILSIYISSPPAVNEDKIDQIIPSSPANNTPSSDELSLTTNPPPVDDQQQQP